jgi:hypothetical protein
MDTGGSFFGVEQSNHEPDHLFPFSAEGMVPYLQSAISLHGVILIWTKYKFTVQTYVKSDEMKAK